MRAKAFVIAFSATALVTALTTVGAQQDVKAAIEAANKQFASALAKGDAAAIGAMYTSTGMAFPPNGDVVRGRDAIQKMWQGVIASGVKEATLTPTEVEAHGDTAYEIGTYTMGAGGGKQLDRGKYIVIWKRENGQWKLHRDIWNTSMPAPTTR